LKYRVRPPNYATRYVPTREEAFIDGDAFTIRVTDGSAETTFAERAGVVTSYTRSYQDDCNNGGG
jgi:hypothetical protein